MDYRLFGRTGVKVAPLALGTANFGRPTPEDEAQHILDRALDAGINLIDTANSYAEGDIRSRFLKKLHGSGGFSVLGFQISNLKNPSLTVEWNK